MAARFPARRHGHQCADALALPRRAHVDPARVAGRPVRPALPDDSPAGAGRSARGGRAMSHDPSQGEKKVVPFWPHYLLSEFIAWYIVLGILVTLAAMWPAGLEAKANAMLTPQHVK